MQSFLDDEWKQHTIIKRIMNTITNIFTQARNAGTQPISFEIFPPKGELSMESARSMAEELAKLDPQLHQRNVFGWWKREQAGNR